MIRNKLVAEGLGTTFLLATVVGSGIMAERLASGNLAVALLANAVATGVVLYVLISLFSPISGAHFNPTVTIIEWIERRISMQTALLYIFVQYFSAVLGVVLAHLMFELPIFTASEHIRNGPAQWLSEFLATFGLLLTILLGSKSIPKQVPVLVACYITGAYWFTSSTSFSNPAVTFARSLTNTFAGIRPNDVVLFSLAQILGAIAALGVAKILISSKLPKVS